jgi:hypothetical protein
MPLGNVTTVQVTRIGYPIAIDNGYQVERTDAAGWYFTSGNLKNMQIGSAETGGWSGVACVVTFGTPPSIDSGSSGGSAPVQAIIVVTSSRSTTGSSRRQTSYI